LCTLGPLLSIVQKPGLHTCGHLLPSDIVRKLESSG
jgi:hypothetical protein